MSGGAILAVALLCASYLPCVDAGYYFYLKKETPRCFIEDVPRETLVMGTYKTVPDAKNLIVLVVTAPSADRRHNIDGEEIVIHTVKETDSRFAFTAHEDGEHLICVYINSTDASYRGQQFRFELKFDVGEQATNYEEMAKSEHISAIELEVRKLIDTVKDIAREQDYLKVREQSFRDTSESTNSRVVWWTLIQTLILGLVAVWQVTQLKTFFKSKKMA